MSKMQFDSLANEFQEIFRAFNLPYENFDYRIEVVYDSVNITLFYDNIYSNNYKLLSIMSDLIIKRTIKRLAKRDLYRLLSRIHNIKLPYGSLTGVRPTKLFYDLNDEFSDAEAILIDEFDVSEEKARLISRVITGQKGIYNVDTNKVDLFINIPFCASRCAYCSFISAEIGKNADLLDKYVEKLSIDITKALILLNQKQKKIRSVYVGGGTPTSLSDKHFAKLLNLISNTAQEMTVEAGRPDSITRGKLDIMKECGVSRISINPQTFSDKTLKLISRNHNTESIYMTFEVAREYYFDINMDLIAMLPEEGLEDFVYSVNEAVRLRPENITIHTLALKKGSKLKYEEYDNTMGEMAEQMINYADKKLSESGYLPYYMYRQKYMSGNLENTGYTLYGKQCVYNIDIMEETHSIVACGAGGISKFVVGDRIERAANVKDIKVYLERFDEMMSRRERLFENL